MTASLDGKTFVVTGGLGFIGSHFVETVLDRFVEARVVCVDKQTYASNPGLVKEFEARFGARFTQVTEDIADLTEVPGCDFLVNFAAETHVDNSISASDDFMKTNVLGAHNLLEILRQKKIRHMEVGWEFRYPVFLQVSTDEVFGDQLTGATKENRVHKPSNPYAASKSAAEQLVVAWGRTYGIPYLITRTTNNYGPRQHPEKLVPQTITKILAGKKVPVHGGGLPRRNWVHVLDNVEALLLVLEKGKTGTSYHIGTDEELSVREVVETVAEYLGTCYDRVSDFSMDRSGVDERYCLNSSKVRRLGWKPVRTLKSSLPDLVRTYDIDRGMVEPSPAAGGFGHNDGLGGGFVGTPDRGPWDTRDDERFG